MKRRPKKPSQYLVKSEEGDEDGLLQTQAGEGPTASVPREEARPLPSALLPAHLRRRRGSEGVPVRRPVP